MAMAGSVGTSGGICLRFHCQLTVCAAALPQRPRNSHTLKSCSQRDGDGASLRGCRELLHKIIRSKRPRDLNVLPTSWNPTKRELWNLGAHRQSVLRSALPAPCLSQLCRCLSLCCPGAQPGLPAPLRGEEMLHTGLGEKTAASPENWFLPRSPDERAEKPSREPGCWSRRRGRRSARRAAFRAPGPRSPRSPGHLAAGRGQANTVWGCELRPPLR